GGRGGQARRGGRGSAGTGRHPPPRPPPAPRPEPASAPSRVSLLVQVKNTPRRPKPHRGAAGRGLPPGRDPPAGPPRHAPAQLGRQLPHSRSEANVSPGSLLSQG